MGIGLSLSRTIIEEVHGGKLWLDKDHQNGALFGFELPVFQCPDQGNGSVENSKSELA